MGTDEVEQGTATVDTSPAIRNAPKWQARVMDRLKDQIRRFNRPLRELYERDANEGDTRLIVTDFLSDALGYDKYCDLSTEYRVRGEFADYGLRIDKQLVAFVEVKRVTTKLGAKHLRQAQSYALNEGVEWIVLTNGAEWHVYHVTAAMPVETELAFEANLLDGSTTTEKAKKLFYLTTESLKRRQIDELWRGVKASSPESLAAVLQSEPVVDAIRLQLRRETGHRLSQEEVLEVLRSSVLRPECLHKG